MNLSKLFAMQKELDDYIIEKKGLQGVDLLPQKILALQVELGECANEWRGFKFWSERQTPKIPVKKYGVHLNTGEEFESTEYPLLEEYVDCLHFILSIGLESEFRTDKEITPFRWRKPLDSFSTLMRSEWEYEAYYEDLSVFLGLGEMLGFTWNQIESAYTEKWSINKKRQENGY